VTSAEPRLHAVSINPAPAVEDSDDFDGVASDTIEHEVSTDDQMTDARAISSRASPE
jgi:hypothetical protein